MRGRRLVYGLVYSRRKKMQSVGAYEAKTHLPQLLDRVARGERIVITKNGKPVAMLVPAVGLERPNVQSVVDQMHVLRNGNSLGGHSIRELIDEGRNY
jgi:prevent-host-death family protein